MYICAPCKFSYTRWPKMLKKIVLSFSHFFLECCLCFAKTSDCIAESVCFIQTSSQRKMTAVTFFKRLWCRFYLNHYTSNFPSERCTEDQTVTIQGSDKVVTFSKVKFASLLQEVANLLNQKWKGALFAYVRKGKEALL